MLSTVLRKTAEIGAVAVICLLLVAGMARAESQIQKKNATPDIKASAKKAKKNAKPAKAQQAVAAASGVTAQTSAVKNSEEWGPYLDVAYQLTYWDKADIKKWRQEVESRFNLKLSDYIVSWNGKLIKPATTGEGAPEKKVTTYLEQDYLRLAAAETLDYLETDNRESLNGAEQVLDRLKEKSAMPRVAYWLGFVKALQALENKDSAAFVAQVYLVWNNSIRYSETAAIVDNEASGKGAEAAGDASIPHLYRNIASIVAKRAIIERKLGGLEALGPLFDMLNDRDLEETVADGRYLTTMVQRVNEIFIAPDLDRWRLNFAVGLIEAHRLQRVAEGKLDTERMSDDARKSFEQAREFYDHVLTWAASRRSSGSASVMADYLDITSFAVQRLLEKENAGSPAFAYFANLPGHDGAVTLKEAMDTFSDLAVDNDWEKAGYGEILSYQPSMHRLWRAIMELSLWNGDYYLAQLNSPSEQGNIISIAASLQGALNTYIDFFTAQAGSKAVEVVPASAYFGAAEAAVKLSYSYRLSDNHSVGQTSYNQWFVNRLLAVELYPFDAALIAETASALKRDGRYGLFIDYFLPLAERFKGSPMFLTLRDTEAENQKNGLPAPMVSVDTYIAVVDDAFAVSAGNPGQRRSSGKETSAPSILPATLRRDLQRNPEHETHQILKAFYQDELGNNLPIRLLLKDPNRLDQE